MTPKAFCRALLAYIFATLTVVVLAAVLTEVLQVWVMVLFWQVTAGLWLVTVGQISLRWSLEKLGRSLSVRPAPSLRITRGGLRAIPVAGDVLADTAAMVGGRGGVSHSSQVTVADAVFITCGEFTFTEQDILKVLRRGWVRQRSGQHPLSRRYWLGREPFWGDRRKYDAFADSLDAVGAVVGRSDRSSGKMIKPPLSTIYDLRYLALG